MRAGGHSSTRLLGCRFDRITNEGAVGRAFEWTTSPERTCHIIVTVNASILVMGRQTPALAEAIERADLVVADGAPIVWVSRILADPLPERVTGVDLMEQFLAEGSHRGLRVFLLGTSRERLETLLAVIRASYPGVVIAGARDGYWGDDEDEDVLSEINESRADLLLLGMPAPRKEIWCERYRSRLDVPVVLGVGGAFDVLAGYIRRAPVALQKAGFEWAWRLWLEPRRLWRRYLVTNSQFLGFVLMDLARAVLRPRRSRREA
jgi:N-acetylglucosaminyldiphosphoundecaprenol N-acetyl-beta-D-mannosaminyltransferase